MDCRIVCITGSRMKKKHIQCYSRLPSCLYSSNAFARPSKSAAPCHPTPLLATLRFVPFHHVTADELPTNGPTMPSAICYVSLVHTMLFTSQSFHTFLTFLNSFYFSSFLCSPFLGEPTSDITRAVRALLNAIVVFNFLLVFRCCRCCVELYCIWTRRHRYSTV